MGTKGDPLCVPSSPVTMAPTKKKKPALKPTVPKPAAPKVRSRNHKTKKDPWEACTDEVWEVDKILHREYRKGVKFYGVRWVPLKDVDGNELPAEETVEPIFVDEYKLNWAPVKKPAAAAATARTTPKQPAPVASSLNSFSDFLTNIARVQPSTPSPAPVAPLLNEAEAYLQEAPANIDVDPLVWWGTNEKRFPNLARMAAQFLSVPATSAPAERIFSLAGEIFDDHSTGLNDVTLEERMWAKLNTGKRRKLS